MPGEIDYEAIDDYDYDAWLAAPPPVQFGPAIHAILASVKALTDEQRAEAHEAYVAACLASPLEDVDDRCIDAFYDHPIGAGGCGPITDVERWVSAVAQRIGRGPGSVLRAVASRDHKLISDADFALLTDWWVRAGHALPEPIGDDGLSTLHQWWKKMDEES